MVQKHASRYKLGVIFFFINLLAGLFEYFQRQQNQNIAVKILQILNLAFSTSLLTHLALFIGASRFSTFTLHDATSLIILSIIEWKMNTVQSWPVFINLVLLVL